MYFPLPAESAPKGMGAPLLKIFAEAKYFNPELFSVTVGKRLYYLIQLYTSYSEFAKIHTDVRLDLESLGQVVGGDEQATFI